MQRGIALLVVLWACTLLAILVGGFASIARVEALQTQFSLGQQRARYAAEAGVSQAIATIEARRHQALLDQMGDGASAPQGMPGDGRALAFAFDGLQVAVGIQDESGKVDINRADRRTLKALFGAAGCDEARTEALTTGVEAWRGPVAGPVGDDGAAVASALSATSGVGPRKYVPFTAIEELQSLPGMDPALYAALEPAITVLSGQSSPQPQFAPLLAMATLRGLDLAKAREVIAMRDGAPPGTILRGLPGGLTFGDSLPSDAMTFRVTADDGHGSRAVVEATVRFETATPDRDPRVPLYTIIRWRDGPPS
ncbi:MAG: type II secretion system protein GspK [Luteibacter sp.]